MAQYATASTRSPRQARFKMRFIRKYVRRVLVWIVRRHPHIAYDVLRKRSSRDYSFAELPERPQRNFEDLDWMFESNPVNKGVLLLEFDEAAHLFRLARSRPAARILEIGRWRGGSTFLFAVAGDQNSIVTSIDIAPQDDKLLLTALDKNNLSHKVELLIGSSPDAEVRPDFYDLIFVDGDHSYEGAARDYEHWKKAVKPGGHLAFHNAAQGRLFTVALAGPMRLMREITARESEYFQRQPDVGSLALFVRTAKPWKC
jgi:predicted O-methyltransferase YrrM